MDFVKAEATPVGFRESDEEGNLHWVGPFKTRFEPGKMVVKAIRAAYATIRLRLRPLRPLHMASTHCCHPPRC
ncbi:hypothetical protein CF326_g6500 [Tilletia indica]|nr:hypothetical protein CF326_g6500 [Tilletia indica]